MRPEQSDRAVDAALGALAGAAWGLVIMLGTALVTGVFHGSLIAWCAGVFGVLGALRGHRVVDAFVALMLFGWGLLSVLAARWPTWPTGRDNDALQVFAWLGAGTAIALMLWWGVG